MINSWKIEDELAFFNGWGPMVQLSCSLVLSFLINRVTNNDQKINKKSYGIQK